MDKEKLLSENSKLSHQVLKIQNHLNITKQSLRRQMENSKPKSKQSQLSQSSHNRPSSGNRQKVEYEIKKSCNILIPHPPRSNSHSHSHSHHHGSHQHKKHHDSAEKIRHLEKELEKAKVKIWNLSKLVDDLNHNSVTDSLEGLNNKYINRY